MDPLRYMESACTWHICRCSAVVGRRVVLFKCQGCEEASEDDHSKLHTAGLCSAAVDVTAWSVYRGMKQVLGAQGNNMAGLYATPLPPSPHI